MNKGHVNVLRLPRAEARFHSGLSTNGLLSEFGVHVVTGTKRPGLILGGPIFAFNATGHILPILASGPFGFRSSATAREDLNRTAARFVNDGKELADRLIGLKKRGEIPVGAGTGHLLDWPGGSTWQLTSVRPTLESLERQVTLGDAAGRVLELGLPYNDERFTNTTHILSGFRTPHVGATVALWNSMDDDLFYSVWLHANPDHAGSLKGLREVADYVQDGDDDPISIADVLSAATGQSFQKQSASAWDVHYESNLSVFSSPRLESRPRYEVGSKSGAFSLYYRGVLTNERLMATDGPILLPVPEMVARYYGAIQDAWMTGNALPPSQYPSAAPAYPPAANKGGRF